MISGGTTIKTNLHTCALCLGEIPVFLFPFKNSVQYKETQEHQLILYNYIVSPPARAAYNNNPTYPFGVYNYQNVLAINLLIMLVAPPLTHT